MMLGYLAAAILVAAFVFLMARQPDEFRVTRETFIKAHPKDVFGHVNDLRKWNEWSPWARMDPEAVYGFEGPAAGIGAVITWDGKKTGAGKMAVVESDPGAFVKCRLEFYKPMRAVNMVEFAFKADDGGTRVSWTMYGPNGLMGKIMGFVMDCEKMVGEQFDQGLENLRETVEKR